VHETGRREVIGLDVGKIESEAFWREFLRSLRCGRGQHNVRRGAARAGVPPQPSAAERAAMSRRRRYVDRGARLWRPRDRRTASVLSISALTRTTTASKISEVIPRVSHSPT
jgi:transposase-like protein